MQQEASHMKDLEKRVVDITTDMSSQITGYIEEVNARLATTNTEANILDTRFNEISGYITDNVSIFTGLKTSVDNNMIAVEKNSKAVLALQN